MSMLRPCGKDLPDSANARHCFVIQSKVLATLAVCNQHPCSHIAKPVTSPPCGDAHRRSWSWRACATGRRSGRSRTGTAPARRSRWCAVATPWPSQLCNPEMCQRYCYSVTAVQMQLWMGFTQSSALAHTCPAALRPSVRDRTSIKAGIRGSARASREGQPGQEGSPDLWSASVTCSYAAASVPGSSGSTCA